MAISGTFKRKPKRPSKKGAPKVDTATRNLERVNRVMEDAVRVHLFNGVRALRSSLNESGFGEAVAAADYARVFQAHDYSRFDAHMDKAAKLLTNLGPQTAQELRRGIKGGIRGPGANDKRLTQVIDFGQALGGGAGTPGPKRNAFHRAARRIDAATGQQDQRQAFKEKNRAYMRRILTPEKKAIFETVRHGVKTGMSPKQISASIISKVGLTRKQSDAVQRTYDNAFANGASYKQAEALRDAHSERLLQYRADTIAITETRTLSESIKTDEWLGQQEAGLLGPNPRVTWLLGALDDKACPVCIAISNTSVPLGEAFVLEDGRECLPGFAHPRCRCHAMLTTDDDTDGREATAAEIGAPEGETDANPDNPRVDID